MVRSSGRAVLQDQAEFVAGEHAEMIGAAHLRADAFCDLRDGLVGDGEAIGFVEMAEIVDRDQQEAAGAAEADRFIERGVQRLD